MAKHSKIVCIDLGSAIYPSEPSGIDLNAVATISDQFVEIAKSGYRIVAFVGAGGIGDKVLRVAKEYKLGRSARQRIIARASDANALLLIDCLLQKSAKVRSTPYDNLEQLGADALSGKWDVFVAEEASADQCAEFAIRMKAAFPLVTVSEKGARSKRVTKTKTGLTMARGGLAKILASMTK